MQQLAIRQCIQRLVPYGKAQPLLIWAVALALHDQHRAVRVALVARDLDPVVQWIVAEGQPAVLVCLDPLRVFGPDRHQHGGAAQEQRVRAVVDVLAAKVPDVQPCRWIVGQGHHADLDAVCGIPLGLEGLAGQPPNDLGLACPAIAEQQELDVRRVHRTACQIGEVRAHRIQTVRFVAL